MYFYYKDPPPFHIGISFLSIINTIYRLLESSSSPQISTLLFNLFGFTFTSTSITTTTMVSLKSLFAAVVAFASVALAEDVVWFENYTNQERWIVFTTNVGWHSIGDTYLPPGSASNPGKATVKFDNLGPDGNSGIALSPPGAVLL
jgi:hypothetical protein